MAADIGQCGFESFVVLILPLDQLVACHAISQHYGGVVGGGIAIDSDPIKGLGAHLPQGVLQHLLGDSAVGGKECQHGTHVGMDHAGTLGDSPQSDFPASHGEGDGNFFFYGVGSHDGRRRVAGAVRGQGCGSFGQAGLDGLNIDGLADDPSGGHHKILSLPSGGLGGKETHCLRILMAHGTAGVGVAAVGDNAPGYSVLQVVHRHIDGSCLDSVQGVDPGGGTLLFR